MMIDLLKMTIFHGYDKSPKGAIQRPIHHFFSWDDES